MLTTPDNGLVPLKAEILDRAALPALLPHWDDLSRRCVEDNVYYAPRYAMALLASVDRDRRVRVAIARRGQRLVGLLPFVTSGTLWPGWRAGVAWQTPYTYSCTPLLDARESEAAAAALLRALADAGVGAWMIPNLNIQGGASLAMIAALDAQALPWRTAGGFQRAAIVKGLDFETHMRRCIEPKRRRELARSRRRLGELGRLEHTSASGGDELEAAVKEFLEIEENGWKGRRGTGLACDPRSLQFAMSAFTGDCASSICRADVLRLDGRPLAVSLIALAGRTGFTVKCTYDEGFRSYGAGLLLEEDVIRSFLNGDWADRLDAATAGMHVIDKLWPERMAMADLIFAVDPALTGWQFSALLALDGSRRALRSFLKKTRDRVSEHTLIHALVERSQSRVSGDS